MDTRVLDLIGTGEDTFLWITPPMWDERAYGFYENLMDARVLDLIGTGEDDFS